MDKIIAAFLLSSALSCSGVTVVGTLQSITGGTIDDDNILFVPASTPWANGNNIVIDRTHRVATSNETFSVKLLGGVYETFFTGSKPIYIYAPINDTNTYQFTFLATNLLTMALINSTNARIPSTLITVGTNGILFVTNSPGTLAETITISVTNVLGVTVLGAVSQATHSTNADFATSAVNATNLFGGGTGNNFVVPILNFATNLGYVQITSSNSPPTLIGNNAFLWNSNGTLYWVVP